MPDTDLEGVDADQVFDVTAADVVGYLGETNGASNTDYYSFTAQAGTLINFQLMSVALTRNEAPAGTLPTDYNQAPFDTYLVIYNSSGQVIEYNDDSFQDADSSIIDLTLPYTGTYYAMVTSSPKSVSLNEPLTGDYELFMYTFAAGATAAYPSTTPGLGDTMYAGSGDDTIIAGSADDTIADPPPDTIVYGSGAVNMLQADTSLNVSAGPNQSIDEGTTVTLTGSFLDPSGDTNPIFDWHVVAASGQLIADGTGTSFTFTPGNAGTYTVTLTVIDLNVGWDSADVVDHVARRPTGSDRPQRLAERLRGREHVDRSRNARAHGHWSVYRHGQLGRWPELDLLADEFREQRPGSHVCDGGDLHDRRDRLGVLRRHDDHQLLRRCDRRQHVDDAHLVVGLLGLRPIGNLDGHGGRLGRAPTGTVTFYAGAVTPADQIGTGTLSMNNGVDAATFSTSMLPVSGSPYVITAVYDGDRRQPGQHLERRQPDDHPRDAHDHGKQPVDDVRRHHAGADAQLLGPGRWRHPGDLRDVSQYSAKRHHGFGHQQRGQLRDHRQRRSTIPTTSSAM